MQTIVLKTTVRVFVKELTSGPRLRQARKTIPAGTTVLIDDPCMMSYDHRDQMVVPIFVVGQVRSITGDESSFLLLSEIIETAKEASSH